MHEEGAGKPQCRAGSAFVAGPQHERLALDLLPRQLSSRVLRRRKMPLLDTRRVRVIAGDPRGGQYGPQFQAHYILPGANDVRQHFPCVMINRLPQPPCLLFGADETPHFIHFGCASWQGAVGA